MTPSIFTKVISCSSMEGPDILDNGRQAKWDCFQKEASSWNVIMSVWNGIHGIIPICLLKFARSKLLANYKWEWYHESHSKPRLSHLKKRLLFGNNPTLLAFRCLKCRVPPWMSSWWPSWIYRHNRIKEAFYLILTEIMVNQNVASMVIFSLSLWAVSNSFLYDRGRPTSSYRTGNLCINHIEMSLILPIMKARRQPLMPHSG